MTQPEAYSLQHFPSSSRSSSSPSLTSIARKTSTANSAGGSTPTSPRATTSASSSSRPPAPDAPSSSARTSPPRTPGSAQGLYLIVSDIEAAHAELLSRGAQISEIFHGAAVGYGGTDEPYLFGRMRVSGPDPEHRSYRTFASFKDPDGNGWLLQELTTRLPGRIDSGITSFASAADLAAALRRAGAAHGEHEKRNGGKYDENWPDWYAEFMVSEQSGAEPPK